MRPFSNILGVIKQMGILAAIALLLACAMALFHPHRPLLSKTPEVPLAVVLKRGTSVLWVDSRSEADFELSHIDRAIRVSEADWERCISDFWKVWDKQKQIVVYCGDANCLTAEGVATRLLQETKAESVWILKGGLRAWKKHRH